MCMNKGQASLEYLVITAFILLIVGLLAAFSFLTLGDSLEVQKAATAANRIADAATVIVAAGNGSVSFVKVELPNNLISSSAIGNVISIRLSAGSGFNDVTAYSEADLTPAALPSSPGVYSLKLEVVDGNVVITQV